MSKISLKDLLEAGAHFGHQARRWHPGMKPFIYGERDGVHIFDLVKTKEGLEKAAEFVKTAVQEGKVILFVGTKKQAQAVIKMQAERVGMPYISVRWIGGLLTNWQEISKRIRKLRELKEGREKGEFARYTKRERLLIDREIAKLEKFFAGVAGMSKLPEVIFVVDTHREAVAVAEANRTGIPVAGMVDTNADPGGVDVVIPVNDDAVKAIELVVTAVADAVEEAKNKREKVLEKEAAAAKAKAAKEEAKNEG